MATTDPVLWTQRTRNILSGRRQRSFAGQRSLGQNSSSSRARLRRDSSGSGQASGTPHSSACCLSCIGAFAEESGRHWPIFGRSLSRRFAPRLPAIRFTPQPLRHGTVTLPPPSAQRRLPCQRLSCLPRSLPLPRESGADAAINWTLLTKSPW